MECFNVLDRMTSTPYDCIRSLSINGHEVNTRYLIDMVFNSYGKYEVVLSLYPGIHIALEKLASFKQGNIVVSYIANDSSLILTARCDYDHFIIESSTIRLVYYSSDKNDTCQIEEEARTNTRFIIEYEEEPTLAPEEVNPELTEETHEPEST